MEKRGAVAGRSALTRICAAVATILLVFSTAVACIAAMAFDAPFYKQEYAKMNTSAYVGVDDAVLQEATDTLLDYLQDKRPSLDMSAQINGEQREYYSDREKAHMVDVKNLYQGALVFMVTGFIVGGVLLALCFVWKPLKNPRKTLQTYFWTTIGILALFTCIGVFAAVDFGTFWVGFHHVFFTNDLWLLDPAESLMIRMFEQDFFADLVGRILAVFLVIVCAAGIAAGIMNRRMKKHAGC